MGRSEWSPPTDEQLENFIRVMIEGRARRAGILDQIDPAFGARMAVGNPVMKQAWLERHREFQEAIRHA